MNRGIYVVDNPQRDLSSVIWWLIESDVVKSHDVWVVPMEEMNYRILRKLKPDYVIWNYARPANEKLIVRARRLGVVNVVHDTEGIPYDLERLWKSTSDRLLAAVDEVWCWGRDQAAILKSRAEKLELKTNILCSGSIRYEYIKSLPKKDFKGQCLTVLLNTNFPILAPRYQSAFDEYRDVVFRDKTYTESEYIDLLIRNADMRSGLISSVRSLLQDRQDIKIIIRPHPFERLDYYVNAFSDYPVDLIEFSYDKDVQEDLSRADIVLQAGCQTVLDAAMRGVVSVTVRGASMENIWAAMSIKLNLQDFPPLQKKASIFAELKRAQDAKINGSGVEAILHNFKNNLDLQDSIISDSAFVHSPNSALHRGVWLFILDFRAFAGSLFRKFYHSIRVKAEIATEGLLKKPISVSSIVATLSSFCAADDWIDSGFPCIKPHHRVRVLNKRPLHGNKRNAKKFS